MASTNDGFKVEVPNHLLNLSAAEAQKFFEFKEICGKEGFLDYHVDLRGPKDLHYGISDDGTLLRFLQARKFEVEKALKQYRNTRKWRNDNSLIEVYETVDIKAYDETRKLYTHWTGRRDKIGMPLYLFEVGRLDSSTMAAYTKSCAANPPQTSHTSFAPNLPTKTLRLFATFENMIRFVIPLCSVFSRPSDKTPPVIQTTCIVDFSGVGLMQLWSLKNHMQDASTLATAHYPETLGRIFIIGAPSFFPVIWSWIKKWFDPHTVSKVFIVPSSGILSTLSAHIDPVNIPEKYGGQLKFEFGMTPNLDPAIVQTLVWSEGAVKGEFPIGSMKWVAGKEEQKAIAVGTVEGYERTEEIAILPFRVMNGAT